MALAAAAAAYLAERTGVARHDVALVLGSGWGRPPTRSGRRDRRGRRSPTSPASTPPAVAGHAGTIRSVRCGDDARARLPRHGPTSTRATASRLSCTACARPPRPAARPSCSPTAAAGCGRELGTRHAGAHQRPHQPHRDLAARGADLRRPHRPLLARGCARSAATSTRASTRASTCQFRGPHYETPAEVQMAKGHRRRPRRHVDDARGDRRAAGRAWRCSGISLVTNLAAGITDEPLNHAEVLEPGQAAAGDAAAAGGRACTRVTRRTTEACPRPGYATRPAPGSPTTPTRRRATS